jgi:hypothetical protein
MSRIKEFKIPTSLTIVMTVLFAAMPTIAAAELSDYYENLPWYSYLIAAAALACAVGILIWLFAHRGKAKVEIMSDMLSENIAKPQIAEKVELTEKPRIAVASEDEVDEKDVDDADVKTVDDSDLKGNEWVEVD